MIVGALVAAIHGNIAEALGWLSVGGIGVGVGVMHFVSKRDRSDDPNTYSLGQYYRDMGEDA